MVLFLFLVFLLFFFVFFFFFFFFFVVVVVFFYWSFSLLCLRLISFTSFSLLLLLSSQV